MSKLSSQKFGCDAISRATSKVSTNIYSKGFLHELVCHFNEIATQKVDAEAERAESFCLHTIVS
jgi:hypothetical protein